MTDETTPGSSTKITPANEIVMRILSGIAERERVERRCDAGEQAEAGVGEEEHEDERPGDLHRGEEHLAECR